ncbi:hypothetical protein R1sor_015167 [Riccia sorocarpa]|uniref:Myb/SANT-like DNA-binding domain-containing protein n=1 Tax=Riccia sorocarpa TaxID=122646 RepID=A0ABD3HBT9_9MARC
MARPFWMDSPAVMDSQDQHVVPPYGVGGEFSFQAFRSHPPPAPYPGTRGHFDINVPVGVCEDVDPFPPQPVYTSQHVEPTENRAPRNDRPNAGTAQRQKKKPKAKGSTSERSAPSRPRKGNVPSSSSPDERSPSPDEADPDGNDNRDSEVETEEAGRGRKWKNWEITVLLEAKKDEAVMRLNAAPRGVVVRAKDRWDAISKKIQAKGVLYDGPQCRCKWNVLVREYRKIVDHNSCSGKEPWESMSSEERKEANLPQTFETEHLRILDSFMKDRAGQNPASVADSSLLSDNNVDDSDEANGKETTLNGKRKRVVGENTRFLVDGMKDSMKELGDVMTKLEAERIVADKEIEHGRMQEQSRNCERICDVLRMLAGAMAGLSPGPYRKKAPKKVDLGSHSEPDSSAFGGIEVLLGRLDVSEAKKKTNRARRSLTCHSSAASCCHPCHNVQAAEVSPTDYSDNVREELATELCLRQ